MLIGLIGKPNVGKSTFFKALTLADVLIANYPFATIKPNHGIGYVKVKCVEKEFNVKCNPREGFCKKGWRFLPVEFIDVAGLVPGASEGKGLGNQFLDNLRQADALIHIVDMSGKTNEEGKKTENYDPLNDIKFLEKEIDLWYASILKKAWNTFSKAVEISKDVEKSFVNAITKQFSGLKVLEEDVKEVLRKIDADLNKVSKWNDDEIYKFASLLRKKTKPMIIAANKIDMPEAKENFERIKKIIEYPVIPCSADSELALKEANKVGLIDYLPGEKDFKICGKLSNEQKKALEKIRENVLEKFDHGTGVQQIINYVVFDLLKHIVVWPVKTNKLTDSDGRVLPDCFLIKKGTTALEFAYHIHTDIGNNFIKAIDMKTKKVLGKDYILRNNDVIEIITK